LGLISPKFWYPKKEKEKENTACKRDSYFSPRKPFIVPCISNRYFSVVVLVDDDNDDDGGGVCPHSSNFQAVVVGLHHMHTSSDVGRFCESWEIVGEHRMGESTNWGTFTHPSESVVNKL